MFFFENRFINKRKSQTALYKKYKGHTPGYTMSSKRHQDNAKWDGIIPTLKPRYKPIPTVILTYKRMEN